MTNDTCVKSPMVPQALKVVSTHAHKIPVLIILSRLLHSRAPNMGGINGDVKSDLSTLTCNNREQIEYFY